MGAFSLIVVINLLNRLIVMCQKFPIFFLSVFLSPFLIMISFQTTVDASSMCSRSLSRLARQRIESGLLSYINNVNLNVDRESDKIRVSSSCPLVNDIYQTESEDRFQEGNAWRCLICGKLFQSEEYLDAHVFRKHALAGTNYDISTTRKAPCLADHCDWLRCDVMTAPVDLPYWRKALCDRSEMTRRQNMCNETLHRCIQTSNSKMDAQIFEMAHKSLCNFLTCEQYWERDHLDMNKFQSFLKVAGATLIVLVVFCYYILVLQMYCEGEVTSQNDRSKGSLQNENLRLEMPIRYGDVQSNIRKRNTQPHEFSEPIDDEF